MCTENKVQEAWASCFHYCSISPLLLHNTLHSPQDIAVFSNLIGSLLKEYDAILYAFTNLLIL